jgi:hypothetical protein
MTLRVKIVKQLQVFQRLHKTFVEVHLVDVEGVRIRPLVVGLQALLRISMLRMSRHFPLLTTRQPYPAEVHLLDPEVLLEVLERILREATSEAVGAGLLTEAFNAEMRGGVGETGRRFVYFFFKREIFVSEQ